MEQNIHYNRLQAADTGANILQYMTVAEEMKRLRSDCYVRMGGEIFYIGEQPVKKKRTGIIRRIFRRIMKQEWKEMGQTAG